MSPNNESGYSLLEVMISLVVLGIAFLALIAAQLGTLNGYVSARDELEAAELGRRVSDILQLQGSQWRYTVGDPSPPPYTPEDPFDSGGVTPFDEANPIDAIISAGGGWIPLVDLPVDVRLNRSVAAISADHLGGKFCLYARGAPVQTFVNFTTGAPTTNAMKFQIAVVYPGPNAVLTDCELDVQITAAELDDVGDPTASPFVPPALEARGYRVSYFGTAVVRRAQL